MASDEEKKEKAPKAPKAPKEGAADKPAPKEPALAKEGKEAKGPREKRDKTKKKAEAGKARQPGPLPRLREKYRKETIPALIKQFEYKNAMQVPRLAKIVLNMGMGEAVANVKVMDKAVDEVTALAGQKPVVTKAKKSIANFKLREGMPIGIMVTLRLEGMWEFFDRLVSFALPRVRDFKGVSPRAFDGRGNYSLGIREQIVFPEVNYDEVEKIRGMNVSIVTTARTDEEARALLAHLGMPFRT
jgi:large subunit ribosomal protein L5